MLALSCVLLSTILSTPWSNLAMTCFASTGRGSHIVLWNETFRVNGRSEDKARALDPSSDFVTALESVSVISMC